MPPPAKHDVPLPTRWDQSSGSTEAERSSLTTYQFVPNHGIRAFQQISSNGKSNS